MIGMTVNRSSQPYSMMFFAISVLAFLACTKRNSVLPAARNISINDNINDSHKIEPRW